MNDIKEHFRHWLLEQGFAQKTEAGNPSTIYDYIKTLDRICKRSFHHTDEQGWKMLAKNIYQELSKQYEYSNQDYFLDIINIRYALVYFYRITTFIYSTTDTGEYDNGDEENDIELYLNFKGKDYLITTVKLNELFQYVLLFDEHVFQHRHKQIQLNLEKRYLFIKTIEQHLRDFVNPFLNNPLDLVYYTTLHISYHKHPKKEKTVLLKFHNFMYPGVDATTNNLLCLQFNENPRNKKGGNYIIKENISGNHPLRLDINPNNNLESYDDNADKNTLEDLDKCIIIKEEIQTIFNVSYPSVGEIIENGNFKFFKSPNGLIYYHIDSVNFYLRDKFHKLDKKYKKVSYDKEGYDNWCDRRYATTKILKISHNSFDKCVTLKNCTYLVYLKNKTLYFIPDLEHLKYNRPARTARACTLKYKKYT